MDVHRMGERASCAGVIGSLQGEEGVNREGEGEGRGREGERGRVRKGWGWEGWIGLPVPVRGEHLGPLQVGLGGTKGAEGGQRVCTEIRGL